MCVFVKALFGFAAKAVQVLGNCIIGSALAPPELLS